MPASSKHAIYTYFRALPAGRASGSLRALTRILPPIVANSERMKQVLQCAHNATTRSARKLYIDVAKRRVRDEKSASACDFTAASRRGCTYRQLPCTAVCDRSCASAALPRAAARSYFDLAACREKWNQSSLRNSCKRPVVAMSHRNHS